MNYSCKKVQQADDHAISKSHFIDIQDREHHLAITENQIVADYRNTDEERRLHLWLEHPDLREEFLDISMSQRNAAQQQQIVKTKRTAILDLWRNLVSRFGYAIDGS